MNATPKKGFIHKASIDFEIESPRKASELDNKEILSSLKSKVSAIEYKADSSLSLLEEIDIQESYEFNYDNVDVDELILDDFGISPSFSGSL